MAVYFRRQNILFTHVPKTGGCFIYQILRKEKARIEKEGVGYQHSPVWLCGKEVFFKQPHVILFEREKESWFKSYHRWRQKGRDTDIPGEPCDLWHPNWKLENIWDRDYDTFRQRVDDHYSDYHEQMMSWYKDWQFQMTVLPFEDFDRSMAKFFDLLGYKFPQRYFKRIGKVNAS